VHICRGFRGRGAGKKGQCSVNACSAQQLGVLTNALMASDVAEALCHGEVPKQMPSKLKSHAYVMTSTLYMYCAIGKYRRILDHTFHWASSEKFGIRCRSSSHCSVFGKRLCCCITQYGAAEYAAPTHRFKSITTTAWGRDYKKEASKARVAEKLKWQVMRCSRRLRSCEQRSVRSEWLRQKLMIMLTSWNSACSEPSRN